MLLFIVLIIIVAAASLLTYMYAQGADTFMPVSAFLNGVSGSNAIYLLVNTSIAANGSVAQCASSVAATLALHHKTVYSLNFTGYSCTTQTGVSGAACFNRILASGIPAILLTTGNSTLSFKGFYGNTLYASGSALRGSSCLLSDVLRVGST